ARFPWYIKIFGGRQSARSIHFLGMLGFVAFTIIHTALVLIVHFQNNIREMVLGSDNSSVTLAITIAVIALLCVFIFYAWASWYSMRRRRRIQHALGALVDPARKLLLQELPSKQDYKPSEITSYFWINGRPPESEEFKRLVQNNFADWRLEVKGLVVNPLCLSLEDLRKLPKQTQTTLHNCIQGWTGIAEWGGVPMTEILQLCGALPQAKYVVFTSYQQGEQAYPHASDEEKQRPFYEVLSMDQISHPQTILSYEMNSKPLPLEHGAPVRLRVETQLGYKMVKYLRSIELVEDYAGVWGGQGGFREDVQYYGASAEI